MLCALAAPLLLAGCAGSLDEGLRYPGSYVPGPIAQNVDDLRGRVRGSGQVYSDTVGPTGSTSQIYSGTDAFTAEPNWQPLSEDSGNGTITLNLVDVPVAEAAKVVLADTVGASYTIDPAVTGSMTIQTSQPVNKDVLLAIFEAALRAKGAILVADAGFYKILPSSQFAGAGVRITPADGVSGAAAGVQMQVVPLAYVAASEMAEILRPIAASGTIVRADAGRNLLVLQGSRNELATLIDTIRVFDVDWMAGKSFGLFRLEFADPAEVVGQLDEIFATEVGGAGKGLIKFLPNRSLKSVLVVSPRRDYVEKAAGWIRRVDTLGGADDKQLYIYHIQNRPAGELATLLQRIYSSELKGEGKVVATTSASGGNGEGNGITSDFRTNTPVKIDGEPIPPATDASLTGDITAGVQPPLQPAIEAGLADASRQATPGEIAVNIVADDANNSLLIMAKPRDYEKIIAILERIDAEANQVLLEATILEVTLTDELKYGLRWFFRDDKKSSFTFSDLATGAVLQEFPGFSYFLNADSVKVALSALSNITDVNVISSPSLMVLDNRKATLQVGDEVPIVTQQTTGVISGDAPIINSVQLQKTGVILNVTPRVNDNGKIVLDIEQEVSNAIETDTSGIDSPTIQQRKIRTTVSVADGQSLTLGGLIQERDTLSKQQIPLAGDIPIIGNLFKHKDDEIRRTELLIIITPKVVRNVQQGDAITEEFRQQLDLTLRPAHVGPPGKHENVDRLLVR